MSWFRYHTDALDNPKIQTLPAVLFRFWVNLLCVSKKVDGFLPESPEISFRCRVPESQVKEWLAELKVRRLLDQDVDGRLFMHDWNEHQFVSDDVTARVRKHRLKRSGNVSVTPPEQSRADNRAEQTQTQSVACVQRPPAAADLNGRTSQRFEEFWVRWPRKQHRDAAARVWVSVVSTDVEADMFACLGRFLASEQVSRAVIPNPENWLMEQSRDRWQGDWPQTLQSVSRKPMTPTEQCREDVKNGIRKI